VKRLTLVPKTAVAAFSGESGRKKSLATLVARPTPEASVTIHGEFLLLLACKNCRETSANLHGQRGVKKGEKAEGHKKGTTGGIALRRGC
jgi:hypothetical protein